LLRLKKALYDAVSENLSDCQRIAVAFSGGVDSSLLAKICHSLNKQVILLTIGFPGSHDIEFSKKIASKMGIEHKIYEINHADLQEGIPRIRQTINCNNVSHIENCIAYFYICTFARQNHLNLVASGNGCDELFCGYDRYRSAYYGGDAEMYRLMERNLSNEFALVKEIKIVASQLRVQVRQPFLSSKFIEFSKTIPIEQKIKGPNDMIRKHILRCTALEMGVPEQAAMKPKKALQYGSSIHKHFRKIDQKRSRRTSYTVDVN
jgi:asparagine synthase (glutamine-hydrolysing)